VVYDDYSFTYLTILSRICTTAPPRSYVPSICVYACLCPYCSEYVSVWVSVGVCGVSSMSLCPYDALSHTSMCVYVCLDCSWNNTHSSMLVCGCRGVSVVCRVCHCAGVSGCL